MIVSYNWLKEYVKFDIPAEELAKRLTMQGLEVENYSKIGGNIEHVTVGQITSFEKHPSADKLTVCKVNDGKETLTIICGASNVENNIKVVVAHIGTKLPNGLEIKKAKIRGEASSGMLCSKQELGLEESSNGIWHLPSDAVIGDPISKHLPEEDYLFNIAVTSNRSDCLSIIGVAREVAAMVGTKVKYPECNIKVSNDIEKPDIVIKNSELCPRYTSRIIKGIKIGESPDWLKEKVSKCGSRSINNVVDVTNYVLYEVGHPLHAFDLNFLEGKKIIVRNAEPKEKMTLLNSSEVELEETMLVIADTKKPVALAGVMGGANSEVSDNTVDLLIESAYFLPSSIRTTSKKVGVSSESSYRFERGTDYNSVILAIDRCTSLIQQLCGGKVSELTDVYPNKQTAHKLDIRVSRVNDVLGTSIKTEEIKKYLESLEFEIHSANENTISVTAPSFKVDVTREIDVIEEIARVYNYNNITEHELSIIINENILNTKPQIHKIIRNKLVSFGLFEIINFTFLNINDANRIDWPLDSCVRIKNPISSETECLRDSMIPSLLSTVLKNISLGNRNLNIFEIGHTFNYKDNKYIEENRLSLGLYGLKNERGLYSNEEYYDFYDLKGIIEELFSAFVNAKLQFAEHNRPILHPKKSCNIIINGQECGYMGEIHPDIQLKCKLNDPLFVAEINLELLKGLKSSLNQYNEIGKYPSINRDLAMIFNEDVLYSSVEREIRKSLKLIEEYKLIDIYRGKQIPEGKKCFVFSLVFRDKQKTLTDEEVNKEFEMIVKSIQKNCGGELRVA